MELVLAAFTSKRIYLRIQPRQGENGGWWLANSEDFRNLSKAVCSPEDFIQNSGQTRVIPLEVLSSEGMISWN